MRATACGTLTATNEDSNKVPTRTPLILLWAVSTLWWSIFTPPDRTWAARVILFQPLWGVRMYWKDPTWSQDLLLFLVVHSLYTYWAGVWTLPGREGLSWLDPKDETIWIYIQVFSLLAVCGGFAGGIVFRERRLKDEAEREEPLYEQRIDEQVLPPLLLASKTTHSRLFPRKHAFTYSYLLVGVPVGVQGRISKMLSVDTERHGWFHIDPADYLVRGQSGATLAEKLKSYLHTQGVTDRDYAFAWLVTAPRFLGYSFNPVSFWYLYDSDTRLKYMVLEVNNTFDERRLYLLRAGDGQVEEKDFDLSSKPVNGAAKLRKQKVFRETWEKDFHVSPFNSRKGSYSLRATDPLATYEETGRVQIDNTIILRSSKEHAKIVARVFSDGEPKDPATISSLQAARFILAWCWVGFATFPRIVWEASKLFFKRKLHVWYRPEVTATSIGRPYTDDEKQLEAFFRALITSAVGESAKPLRVIYEPAHCDEAEVVLYSPGFTYEEDHKRTLTLKVISPAFYSRFVHHTSAKEAFERECFASDEKSRTAVLEHSELLAPLIDSLEELAQTGSESFKWTGALEDVRWAAMRRLRCPPGAQAYPDEGASVHDTNTAAAKSSRIPELDVYVRSQCSDGDIYRRTATKLFLAERIALGVPAALAGFEICIRVLLLLTSMVYSTYSPVFDVLRPRNLGIEDVGTILLTLLLANSIHVWSLLKG